MKQIRAWLRFRRVRWHVIYTNGVCSSCMTYDDAVELATKFGGRVVKS